VKKAAKSAAFLFGSLLRAGMPLTIVSEIGSRTRVVRFVSLDAVPAIDGRGSGRIGVRIVIVSGIITAVIAISQTGAEQRACDQTAYNTWPVSVIAVSAVSTIVPVANQIRTYW